MQMQLKRKLDKKNEQNDREWDERKMLTIEKENDENTKYTLGCVCQSDCLCVCAWIKPYI